jgi:hypothetical protein
MSEAEFLCPELNLYDEPRIFYTNLLCFECRSQNLRLDRNVLTPGYWSLYCTRCLWKSEPNKNRKQLLAKYRLVNTLIDDQHHRPFLNPGFPPQTPI